MPNPWTPGYRGFSTTIRRQVLGGSPLCWICHRNPATEVDHIRAASEGGSDDISNAAPICGGCHKLRTDEQRRRGQRRARTARRLAEQQQSRPHPGRRPPT